MKYGTVRVGAFTPKIKTGNPDHNAKAIIKIIENAKKRGVEIAVFPELCITGYTCADLFFTRSLLSEASDAIKTVAAATPENMIVFVGAPIEHDGRLYNCAVAMSCGKVIGVTAKTELPDYGEFYEKRYFAPATGGIGFCESLSALMGDILYVCKTDPELKIGCEICEDMWADVPPSVELTRAGASVIVNLSASDEVVGKAEYRELLVAGASGRQHCAYIYADAGEGESSTDVVFSGHNIIAENGAVIAKSEPFGAGEVITEIDVQRPLADRRRMGVIKQADKKFETVEFTLGDTLNKPLRKVDKYPFVPNDSGERAELILSMQSRALKTRFDATRSAALVVGLSGGLDSALALLVCRRATKSENIKAVTMPCFGTTDKTLGNAKRLADALGVSLATVDIKETVSGHLKDINHASRDVVYENAQARVRTMTLFDMANACNGLVVGTGDMSELALGWATYNGDHMSSYGVNGGVPKTLVKHLVRYEANRLGGKVKLALEEILNTEISPELLPPENGKIAQKTEDILGKYDLLDFVMYYYCRYGFTREKIEYLLGQAFCDTEKAQRDKAVNTFFTRFFKAQFKRSCLPDGVKIGSVSFSPRSDFRLPSDADRK